MTITIDVSTATMEDLEEALSAIRAEVDRRLSVSSLQQEAERLAHKYEEAVSGKPARQWEDGMVVGPGEKVVEDGIEYVNKSGAWLSVPPSDFILGYQRTTAPSEPVAPWIVGETITASMLAAGPVLREKGGVVYQAVQPHTTADHWAPDLPGMTALWIVAVEPAEGSDKGRPKA